MCEYEDHLGRLEVENSAYEPAETKNKKSRLLNPKNYLKTSVLVIFASVLVNWGSMTISNALNFEKSSEEIFSNDEDHKYKEKHSSDRPVKTNP